MSAVTPMSCLPLVSLIRAYLITSISSVPLLLRPSLATLAFLANSKSRFLNPDANPVLKSLLKKTFYVQFCAGESAAEVRTTIKKLKDMGYRGAILGHACEVVLSKEDAKALDSSLDSPEQRARDAREIAQWKTNTMKTIELCGEGDFVALKFTGAGRQALQRLRDTKPCASAFEHALHEICQLAQKRGAGLLFDAEQAVLQQGIDNWTLYFMKIYNRGERAVVYGTYQAYAKRTPLLLAEHVSEAQKHGFVLGIKLVRGAYLGSDNRDLFWDTIEGTHKCYDDISQCIVQRRYAGLLQPVEGATAEFPQVDLVLATHNAESVRRVREVRDHQAQTRQPRIRLSYGQLMGMADNVSLDIVHEAKTREVSPETNVEIPQAYKYLVWGTLGECMQYLLRRAQENKDAVARTIEARQALGKELLRRMKLSK